MFNELRITADGTKKMAARVGSPFYIESKLKLVSE
jgi:hypothetical protein